MNQVIGPYRVINNKIYYIGNKKFKEGFISSYRLSKKDLTQRGNTLIRESEYWQDIIVLYSSIIRSFQELFEKSKTTWVDVPLLTRTIPYPISRPTAKSDLPFEFAYFGDKAFLSQAPRLYLESLFALGNFREGIYAFNKSFRNEESDYRHLTEFRVLEYVVPVSFNKLMIKFEKLIYKVLLKLVIENEKILVKYLTEDQIQLLVDFPLKFLQIEYKEAINLLRERLGKNYFKNRKPVLRSVDEIQLTYLIHHEFNNYKGPIFIKNYPSEQLAFYFGFNEEEDSAGDILGINADLLFPGFGEIAGGGERITNLSTFKKRKKSYGLNPRDYDWYGDMLVEVSKNITNISGMGMGMERLLLWVLCLPSIEFTSPFPRVSQSIIP